MTSELFFNSEKQRPELFLIIAGCRDFTDYRKVRERCGWVMEDVFGHEWQEFAHRHTHVLSGCAKGADALGIQWANEHGIPIMRFPADWDTYGKAAGPIRNKEMVMTAKKGSQQRATIAQENEFAKAILIAFWDGKSKGTRNIIETARKEGLETIVVDTQETIMATSSPKKAPSSLSMEDVLLPNWAVRRDCEATCNCKVERTL